MSHPLVDHVGVVGGDLDLLASAFIEAGFTVAPRSELLRLDTDGSVTPLGQQNQHVIFDRGYIELTSFDRSDPAHHLAGRATADGLHIVCLAAEDVTSEAARIEDAGFEVTDVRTAARDVDYPHRTGTARFRWAALDGVPEAYTCVVEHLTPALVLTPLPEPHPNGATALLDVTIVCADIPSAVTRWRALAGTPQVGHDSYRFGGADRGLVLCGPDGFARKHPSVEIPNLPWVSGVRVATAGPELTLGPETTGGLVIELVNP